MLRLLSVVVLALTLALVTDASVVRRDAAPITLPFVKRVNTTGTAKLLEIDQARAKALRERSEGHRRPPTTVPATNVAVTYVTTVSVGDPPQNFSLLVDTGSANTWVGAGTPYDTSNAHDTSEQVLVAYGSGFFVGEEYDDTVTLGQCLGIKNQSLGAAVYSEGFDGYDGILGIGPTDLTCGTLLDSDDCIPTVIDNAFSQDLIPCKQVGISYEP
ncbi:aspartic peptidase domain-containing protein, partial [Cerioporus squamosus]